MSCNFSYRFKSVIFLTVSLFILVMKGYPDTLVSVNDLRFTSEFEKETFLDVKNENFTDYLTLYLVIDSTIDKERIEQINKIIENKLEPFKTQSFNKLKESKKVKKVYGAIHDGLLRKYDELVVFPLIFKNGEYNCLTATMLYALVFRDLNIPEEIKLTPGHAYLVAYPQTSDIIVETTNPSKGTVVYNDQFKSNYVQQLRKMKIISQEEYNSQTINELFEKNYNNPELVSMKQLAGAQYHNLALEKLQNLQFEKAFENMEKAYYLHSSKVNSYLLFFTLAATLDKVSTKSDAYAGYLAMMMRFQGSLITSDQLLSIFAKMTYQQLEYEGNVELYEKSYQKVMSSVSDSALKAEMSFLYNFDRGRLLFNSNRYGEAIPFIEAAYAIKPKNSETEQMFLTILSNKLQNSLYDMSTADTMMVQLSHCKEEFPVLSENIKFRKMYLTLLLMLMDRYYYEKNMVKGEEYRKKFEDAYPAREPDLLSINEVLVHSYGTAAGYYFGKGNYKKSRALLKKGLYYVPNNYFLQGRLRATE